jgi:hypothetical protein
MSGFRNPSNARALSIAQINRPLSARPRVDLLSRFSHSSGSLGTLRITQPAALRGTCRALGRAAFFRPPAPVGGRGKSARHRLRFRSKVARSTVEKYFKIFLCPGKCAPLARFPITDRSVSRSRSGPSGWTTERNDPMEERMRALRQKTANGVNHNCATSAFGSRCRSDGAAGERCWWYLRLRPPPPLWAASIAAPSYNPWIESLPARAPLPAP